MQSELKLFQNCCKPRLLQLTRLLLPNGASDTASPAFKHVEIERVAAIGFSERFGNPQAALVVKRHAREV